MFMIKNITIATVDISDNLITDGVIVVEEEKIAWVGEKYICPYNEHDMDAVIDGGGNLMIPGLINAHTHTVYYLMRGLGMDKPLKTWLSDTIWPYLGEINEEEAYLGAYLGYMENLRSGVTYVIDNYYMAAKSKKNVDSVFKAMNDTGIKGMVARGFHDLNFNVPEIFMEETEEIINEYKRIFSKWHGANGGKISACVSPVNLLYTTVDSLEKTIDLANYYKACFHTHVAEAKFEVDKINARFGKTFIEVIDEYGGVNERFHSVHSVWLSKKEMSILSDRGGKVIINPASNLLLASGIVPVESMLQRGVNVSLGTDAPNNNQDMLESMKLAAILPRMENLNPLAVSAKQALRMATIEGAKAVGLEGEIGSIEAGKKADLVLVNMHSLHNTPCNDMIANLVYSANQSDVLNVYINGKEVLNEGKFNNLSPKKIVDDVNNQMIKLNKRVSRL
ncbi:MAG: amidohydrolase [Firmicutes bacterium]|nr:amidohydrolase [Bacillota bacterium]